MVYSITVVVMTCLIIPCDVCKNDFDDIYVTFTDEEACGHYTPGCTEPGGLAGN